MNTIWKNAKSLESIEIVGGFALMLGLFWMTVNVTDAQIVKFADIYFKMLLICLAVYAGKHAPISGLHLQTVGFGQKTSNFVMALIVGTVLAFLAIGATSFNLVPVGIVEVLTGQVALIAIFAAVSEELFFRSTLIPTLAENFNSDVIGILLGSIAFGAFHFAVYNGDQNALLGAFIFSVAATAGNMLFKSTGFGYALHITWNYLVVSA